MKNRIRDLSKIEWHNMPNNVTSELSMAGKEYAVEMKNRAQGIESMVQTSKDTSENMTENLRKELLKSLEDSKSVNNIQALVDDILSITNQTNWC